MTALAASQEDESDLQGESLTYKQCRQLCDNHFVLETTEVLEQLATHGVDLASQGETPAMLRARIRELERRVAWYEARHGPIPEEDMGDANASESLGTEEF